MKNAHCAQNDRNCRSRLLIFIWVTSVIRWFRVARNRSRNPRSRKGAMSVYRVTSRLMQSSGSTSKRPRIRWWMYAILQRVITSYIVAIIAIVLFNVGLSSMFFLLLPVGMSMVITRGQLSRLLHGTFLYGVITILLALLYYGCVTAIEIFIHTPGFGLLYRYHGSPIAVYIVVTTTFAWAIILAPPYNWAQGIIDRRFNLRDFEARRAVEAF